MPLESASFINGLVATNPLSSDPVSQGDDHIRLLKSVLKATFPNLNGAVNATPAEINRLVGLTIDATLLNLLSGASENIQTQLDGKSAVGHGHTISEVTNLQTSLNAKLNASGGTLTGGTVSGGTLTGDLKVSSSSTTVSTTFAMDPANGLVQAITLGASVSFTDSLADGESIVLLVDDGTAFTITWPTITWLSGDGAAPGLQTTIRTAITVFKINGVLYGYASNGA